MKYEEQLAANLIAAASAARASDEPDQVHATYRALRRDAARYLRERGSLVILAGGGRRGTKGYYSHSCGTADAIVPHVAGAALVLLDRGDAENFSVWASVTPEAMTSCPVSRAYMTVRAAAAGKAMDFDAELAAFRVRQANGEIG